MGRDYSNITIADLNQLREIELRERNAFFSRAPKCIALKNRVLAVALCQGAALHYVDQKNGIKDFDIWTFYASAGCDDEFPPRWRISVDFEDPRFGKTADSPHFMGRRVDLLGRSLDVQVGANVPEALRNYLSSGKTASSRFLREKAVVLLEPHALLGTVVWP